MRKFIFTLLLALTMPSLLHAQRITQKLSRGVTAVNRTQGSIRYNSGSYLISWRRFAEEPEDTKYRVYIDGALATETTNTNYVPSSLTDGCTITVNPVYDGVEDASQGGSYNYTTRTANVFMDIDFENTVCPADSFRTPFVFPGDLDGDGETDYVVLRCSSADSFNDMAQAYKSDGTYMWTIDFGPNLLPASGQNGELNVFDMDCDGKADVVIRSSDGTRFWDKDNNTWGLYVNGTTDGDTDNDGIVDYRPSTTRNAPYFMTIIDGETGAEKVSAELDYTQATDGTDTWKRDNRANYMNDGDGVEYAFMSGTHIITYDDGVHPSVTTMSKVRNSDTGHHYYFFNFAYDWVNGQPTNWHHASTYARSAHTPSLAEFHQLRAADVDGDGIDEALTGGGGVNSKKGAVGNAAIGHGDRHRTGDLDPTHPGMETYAIQQSDLMGQVVYDAETGEHLKEWYLSSVGDVGRGECMDIDSTYLGYEVYSTMQNLYSNQGDVIKSGAAPYPYEGIWWDGDLGREKLGTPGGSGYSSNAQIEKDYGSRLAEFSRESDWLTHSQWANRAGFWGDITGDWREEIILMKQSTDNGATGIVGYTTDMYTEHSMYTLQQDPHYLLDCTSRGYYQSPNTSFYLGYQMKRPPLPGTMSADLRWSDGTEWADGQSGWTNFSGTEAQSFQAGKSVMFDISGENGDTIKLNATVQPAKTYFMVPKEHSYTIGGTGAIGGTGEVWKSERGEMVLNANITTTGKTVVSQGTLTVNGTISGPLSLRNYGTLGGKLTLQGDVEFEGSHNYEGCRLMPSEVMTFEKSLAIDNNVYDEVTLGDGTVDKLQVNGDLQINAPLVFTINATTTDNKLLAGTYTLVEATGSITLASDTLISVRALEGQPYTLKVDGQKIMLEISETRDAAENVVWKGTQSNEWDYVTENFLSDDQTYFVQYDKVLFDDTASQYTVNVSQPMVQDSITVCAANDYTFQGDGYIAGTGGLVKMGDGELKMNLTKNSYTGQTQILGGTLAVTTLSDTGTAGSLGAGTQNLKIQNGTLKVNTDNTATNRGIEIADTACINVANADGSLSLKSTITGSDGVLVKDGPGQLNFTYAGEYNFKGLIMRDGTLAQGSSSATFGTAPVTVEGTTAINLISNTSFPAVTYKHPTEILEGAQLTIGGGDGSSQRQNIYGSFTGQGTLVVKQGGVRSYVGSDFSEFDGTVQFDGDSPLSPSVADMPRATVALTCASTLAHYNSSYSATAAALQVGALSDPDGVSSYDELPTFGVSTESWEVGHNDKDATYRGLLQAKSITKVGLGEWTVYSTGSTSSITVSGGSLIFRNFTGSLTTGTVNVQDSGYVAGYGTTNSILVKDGGTLGAGMTMTGIALMPMKMAATLMVYSGGTLQVKVNESGNDVFSVGGAMCRLNSGANISIVALDGKTFEVGDEITIFNSSSRMPTVMGTLNITASDGSEWSSDYLASDGKLVCTGTTGISSVTLSNDTPVDVYTLDGRMVASQVAYGKALDSLPRGVYVVNGKKVEKR